MLYNFNTLQSEGVQVSTTTATCNAAVAVKQHICSVSKIQHICTDVMHQEAYRQSFSTTGFLSMWLNEFAVSHDASSMLACGTKILMPCEH